MEDFLVVEVAEAGRILSQKTQKGFSFEIIQQYFFFNIKKVKKLRTLRILTILLQKAQKGFGLKFIQQ